jgi:epoxyqueuosine reductase
LNKSQAIRECGRIKSVTIASDTVWIEERAKRLGFDLSGVVRAARFPELLRTEEWLAHGYAGEMKYLADGRRNDPESAMPGSRSVIVCALNYHTDRPKSIEAGAGRDASEQESPRGWISRYAWGDDYHDVLRKKLEALVAALRERFVDEPFEARVYADTGPVQERVFAKYAGLGWLGKNTLLLNQRMGSWFFLGAILTTLDLAPTLGEGASAPPDLCGSCRRCIEACPTAALVDPYVLDARRCISYLTIELRGSIPEDFREPIGHHVFGCDICQDVCPWNRRAPVTRETAFQSRTVAGNSRGAETHDASREPEEDSLYLPRLEWLAALTEEGFRQIFRGSPIQRTKWRGLVRNACIALGNSGVKRDTAAHTRVNTLLQRLAASPEPSIAESALWAMSRIQ